MDDIVPEYKKRMARFRLQELKDVLGQLGLARTGRKQDLMDRILALLSDEEDIHAPQKNKLIRKEDVTKIIDDTYRKMPHTGAVEPVTGGNCVSDSSSITPKEEIVDQKIRCPCGSPLKTEFMIQCADPQCHVLQHIPCVIIPLDSTEEVIPPVSSQHYCEICRINRCDPFWKSLAHPLLPVKLCVSDVPDDGSQALQTVGTNFQITRADVCLLENAGYDVQAWCILLNDSVPFRMQWPQYPDLKVNGIPVKTINRPGSKTLGANGRDDGPSISVFLVEGHNTITLSGSDSRPFCLGVRLVKKRTVQQVIDMIPNEQEGESFSEAVARVCRCIGGGMAAANDDSDSDLEVIADNVTINLRCPMSGCRMKTAARFKGCIHLGCFDLHTLVQINQRSRKWQCPICLKNYSLEDIIIDPYLNRIVKMMQPCDEEVTEVEVKSDGSWRTKISRPFMDLERWHLPEGSLSSSEFNFNSNMEVSQVKSERNQLEECYTPNDQEIISMSSGSSDNMQEDDDFQTSNKNNNNNNNNNNPYNSGITNRSSSSSLGDPSVIVLSDSDEETCDVDSGTGDADLVGPSEDVKAEYSEMSNNKGDPFTFPRQPRTVRRNHGTKDVAAD
ncbi:hypothetical protein L1887_16486 [Cichorium endivia]|nr:hypothetical protein L1887_16486 [Cichorium endivia]